MIGLDTNVLVRYIAQDDPIQTPMATHLIEQVCSAETPGFIGLIVLVELVWVSETCYGAKRAEITELLRRILSTRQLVVQEAETVWRALHQFQAGNADFSDCLIERMAKAAGCTGVMTFDKSAATSGMTLLT